MILRLNLNMLLCLDFFKEQLFNNVLYRNRLPKKQSTFHKTSVNNFYLAAECPHTNNQKADKFFITFYYK